MRDLLVELGASDVMEKPVDLQIAFNKAERLVRGRRSHGSGSIRIPFGITTIPLSVTWKRLRSCLEVVADGRAAPGSRRACR